MGHPFGAILRAMRALAVALLIAVLAVTLGIGLLYAYRAQSPAFQQIPVSTAITEIQAGQVQGILIQDDQATLNLNDGTMQLVTTGDRGASIARAVNDANQSRVPSIRPIALHYENGVALGSGFGLSGVAILAILLTLLLPIFLVVLIVLAAMKMSRSAVGRRADVLKRLADLRDRGALTEEEFQREKARVLR